MNYYSAREKKLWKLIRDEERIAKYERLYGETRELADMATDITCNYKDHKPYEAYHIPYQRDEEEDY